ncbi:S-acyl fatty acid synthase thioesterase, medium chain [Tenrec ecaudatus]|uniref:S-acyl fatty acid synthase thioesterase, medium chain n=1 Tax=Tenrec ecaudatus TaxID=94439 RepID=UPI003F5A3C0F
MFDIFAFFPRNEKIVSCLYQNPDAIFRLICFPWAGSGSIYFAKWGQKVHDLLEVHSIRLAGRESRSEEPFSRDINQAVDEIVCALLPLLRDKSFAFFGHSMGAHLAFMTARQLKEQYHLEPMHFFVSSASPPQAVLSCDMSCIFGSEDTIINNVEAWKDVTSGNVGMYHRPGGHFYLLEPSNEDFIQNYITQSLQLSTMAY